MAINFTPDDVASGFNLSKLNSNFDKVETALTDALSRSGNGPNQMEADIDLNSNDLLNVSNVFANSLVLNGQVVTPDELQTIPSIVMTKPVYDPTLKQIPPMYPDDYDPQGKVEDVYDSAFHDYLPSVGESVRSVQSKLREHFSFTDFGAVGDGVTNDSVAVADAIATGKVVDGLGLLYLINTPLSSMTNIKNAAFKVGSIIYPTKDYIRTETSKITNGMTYTAWAQDKAYDVGEQLRVWVNEKESHADGTGRIALYVSDDGGATYVFGEYLKAKTSGETLWSAGFDGTNEYLFVRVPAGTTDVAPYTYTMYKRTLGSGASQNYNGAWTTTNITFPTPSGFTGQPVMVHSFTVGHSSSIVVGASYGEGSAVMRSTNGGTVWVETIIGAGSSFEEPTVRWHAGSGVYCGFMRNGGSGNPRFWFSTDNLANISFFTAPAGYFGGDANSSSTVAFDLDDSGNIHATCSYRNGVIENLGTDDRASAFYLTGPIVTSSSWWTASTTKMYSLGKLPRREQGGASALGQPSVIANGEKVHLYYGMEERTGVISGLGKGNRIANIYQTIIFLNDRGTLFDDRTDVAVNRANSSQLRKISGIDAFALPFNDASQWAPTLVSGRPNYTRNTSTLTISSDTLTLTGTRAGFYIIDTEGAAATDNLSTITDADAFDGDEIILATSSSTRDVTVKHNIGNIICGSDRVLDTAFDKIKLVFFNGNWHMTAFADNS